MRPDWQRQKRPVVLPCIPAVVDAVAAAVVAVADGQIHRTGSRRRTIRRRWGPDVAEGPSCDPRRSYCSRLPHCYHRNFRNLQKDKD